MKLDASDIADLQPVIAAAVRSTLDQLQADGLRTSDRIGYPEPEAAALLGIARHVLRDSRLRGEISARLIGKRYVYSRAALIAYLEGT